MRSKMLWMGCLTLVILIGSLALFVGCETDSATSAVTIQPPSAKLAEGESQEFVASGGYAYHWSMRDETLGFLNTREGSRVVYTSISTASNATQVLTVESTIPEVGQPGTNGGQTYAITAEAYILHTGSTPYTPPTTTTTTEPSTTTTTTTTTTF